MSKIKQFFSSVGKWFVKIGKAIGRWFKSLFVSVDEREPKLKVLSHSEGFSTVVSSIIAILIGLFVGFILMLIMKDFNFKLAWRMFCRLLVGAFGWTEQVFNESGILVKTKDFVGFNPYNFGQSLFYATPLILTGLSVAFAFKTGLFNIGGSGQFHIGATFAITMALTLKLPWWLCLIFAMIGGALWGAIPGLFKAFFNVNEVITAIMFNWIGLYLCNMFLSGSSMANQETNKTFTPRGNSLIPTDTWGEMTVSLGIVIAIIAAIILWVILNKTTFGYELKACGYNRHSARYAGVKDKRSIILSMIISGALAGLAGGIYFLTPDAGGVPLKNSFLFSYGFDGIAIALLANSHPVGVIVTGWYMGALTVAGDRLAPQFEPDFVNVVTGVILYGAALSIIFKLAYKKLINPRKKDTVKTTAQPEATAGESGDGILPQNNSKEENK